MTYNLLVITYKLYNIPYYTHNYIIYLSYSNIKNELIVLYILNTGNHPDN